MELRDLIALFSSKKNLFFTVLLCSVGVSLLIFQFQPRRYEAALMLNVSRSGVQKTDTYAYSQFYRLQADERFADTVVRWLAAPSILAKISEQTGNSAGVVGTISAKRLSSQMIDVRYRADDPKKLASIDRSIVQAVNEESLALDKDAKEPDWFTVVSGAPAISDARVPFWKLLTGGVVTGAFLGFLAVLWSWYMKKDNL